MRLRVLARGWVATPALTQLPHDAHLSGGILANTNWFDTVLEFLPTPVPVNLGYEAVEGGRNAFGSAIFYPHPEPRWMFTVIRAGGRSAHYFAPWALSAILGCASCLLEYIPPGASQQTGIWRSLSRNAAQLALQMGLEDCAAVSKRAFGRQNHSISRDAQCCAHLRPTPSPSGSGTTRSQCP